MNVTFANETYSCTKAVRVGDKATLHLTDGGTVEFIGVLSHAWARFRLDGGDWEVIEPTPSLEERMDSLEGTMKEIMTALINLQK